MYRHTVDHTKGRPNRRVLLHRSYYANDLPRLMPVCRLLGHKPVVDGTKGIGTSAPSRWVACDRCGTRCNPQGHLDPNQWDIGDSYTGDFQTGRTLSDIVVKQLARRGQTIVPNRLPGPFPKESTSDVSAELVIGRSHSIGVDFKVGNPGSENVLAAHIGLGRLGALYLSSGRYGTWIQRRLNNEGYNSRETGVSIHDGCLWWNLWAKRDEWSKSDPKWMRGTVHIDPRHHLLGPAKNRKVSETERVPVTVYMPEGDTHPVTVHLEQWETRRTRGRARTYWLAQWDSEAGIPVRNHDWKGDETYSCSWHIEGVTPDNPRWPYILAAKAAEQCTRDRARYGYRAPEAA